MNKLAFIIPFKPKNASTNWTRDNELLKRTVLSVLNQSSSNFVIYVVTSDELEFTIDHDNLKILHYPFKQFSINDIVDIEIPRKAHNDTHILKILDKCRRVHTGIDEARKTGCTHIMSLDADDLVSNRIVKLVEDDRLQKNLGWFINYGYIYKEGASFFLKKDEMYKVCGGTYVLRIDLIKSPRQDKIYYKDYAVIETHGYLKTYIKNKFNQELEMISFPGIIYVAHSSNMGHINDKLNFNLKFILKTIVFGTFITKKMKKEFNFYKLDSE